MTRKCLICSSENLLLDRQVKTSEIMSRLYSDWGVMKVQGVAFKSLTEYNLVEHEICLDCDAGTWFPTISGDPEFYASISDIYVSQRWDKEVVQKSMLNNKSVLDVGSGPMPIFEKFSPVANSNLAVIDENPIVELALRAKKVRFYSNPKKIPVKTPHFSNIVALHFIEHIQNPVQYFLLLRENLASDGHFWISTPNRNRSSKHQNFEPLDIPPHHVTTWTLKSLSYFSEILNMQITDVWVSKTESSNFFTRFWRRYLGNSQFKRLTRVRYFIEHPEKLHGYQFLAKVAHK
jgi:hypothetical protein